MINMEHVELTNEQIENLEEKRLMLKVPDPWNDKFCHKNGLVDMYIISTITEIIKISAEAEPGIKLNNPNPKYVKFIQIISKFLQTKNYETYEELHMFISNFIAKDIIPISWSGDYIPDIRIAETIEEALGWLIKTYII